MASPGAQQGHTWVLLNNAIPGLGNKALGEEVQTVREGVPANHVGLQWKRIIRKTELPDHKNFVPFSSRCTWQVENKQTNKMFQEVRREKYKETVEN